ncbi:diphosphomevalonate/mevalonate 3,5-bisphosphate decarboxylase family protein [Robiginitalea sp. SC105]|uniref:diphosphomevalonate/mevalonate 3,5-bisphosphate decarboxylase family protein n=1 Tax=Robiginitalea sp. SC105 TaxID=2762332 RepID=UPI00163ABCB0|nr:diphosphomevalonate decarboxylase [Robiginitalea sp. SC105]MBC2837844.1 diphosphomevalonate decarboxylase [Robiginitalea sp. SC105]
MVHQEFLSRAASGPIAPGEVAWQAPSNIALVKYWGKREGQIPTNPSISFTLDACNTRTRLAYAPASPKAKGPVFRVFLDGEPAPGFEPKIRRFLDLALPYLPFLENLSLEIHTENSFPHSSGIASSASGMAALALCLVALEERLDPGADTAQSKRKASFLARLGSGSAARSVDGGLVFWGEHPGIAGSSDLYGIRYPGEVHPVFGTYHDTVLLVDKGQKPVSSTVGHGLMNGHPFASQRFNQARRHLDLLGPALASGDLAAFADLVESEALSLHAMMLTSSPSFILMKPDTLAIIEKIRGYREAGGQPVCFTLDAGANVHVLYPASAAGAVYGFIREALLEHCPGGQHICDRVGAGARRL